MNKKLIQSDKGAGIALVGAWELTAGELPKQSLTFLCWIFKDDPQFQEVLDHMKTLV